MTDAPDRVAVLAFEGVEELDAVGPYDVFATAAAERDGTDVALVAADRPDPTVVTASGGLRVEPDGALDRATPAADPVPDVVVVPGGGWNDRAATGAWAMAQDADFLAALRALHGAGATLAAVCTGGMLLAEAGLLDGRPAVTHRGAVEELRGTDAEVVDARVVDDGDVVTCGGVTAGIDLALWLVEREWGAGLADAVATELEHPRTGDVYRA